jgi:hypothetical protein
MISEVAHENAQRIMEQAGRDEEFSRIDRSEPGTFVILHTGVQLFCSDWECPCHANIEAINAVTSYMLDGLLSWYEANRILRGQATI